MCHCSQASPVPSEPAQPIERKLAAIFAADVAGYSGLMGQDEAGTMRALTAHREVMDRLIAQHRGRIANTAGDSVLAEFPSVVEAVKCAVEIQQELREKTQGVPEDRQLRFRIGVHVGDVMVRGSDLLGDGVNVAARLQALAEPGGICVSGDAHHTLGSLYHWPSLIWASKRSRMLGKVPRIRDTAWRAQDCSAGPR